MFRLVYSNRTEELLAELASAVRAQQMADGPLVPVRIVVPSATLDAAVRLGVAREQGVAANLEVTRLTRLASQMAGTSDGRVADAQAFEAMSLELLLDEALLADPALAPVRGYLRSAGDDADAVDARRVQLAMRLGRLFEEYTFSRAEMLAGWSKGRRGAEPDSEVEAWQRRLWQAMFGAGGLALGKTPRLRPLHEAVASLEPALRGGAIHVFGFAHVARTFHDLLAVAARTGDVIVYTLTPCEGLWEEADARDPPLLGLWGRPGREGARALNALAGFDHDDCFVDPLAGGPPTLLRRVQGDLLRREPATRGGATTAGAGDDSLLVLEHASVRRECEAVASAIWTQLEADPTLRLDEIAVLVPPRDAPAYTAHLAAAFREAHDLPHQLVGIPDASPSRVSEALDRLLALPLGTFTRPELLRLALHPLVAGTVGDVDTARWVAYCDALGVVHGADRSDHEGTYVDRDILNWDQGLRRLALGSLMAGEASGDASAFALGDDEYLPLEIPGSELHDAAAFGVLVRSLIADARFARTATLTPRAWSALLESMVEAYVTPATDAEADELARRLREVSGLADLDLGGKTLGYRAIHELVTARLASSGSSRGEGVVVSTVAAARAIPFRVVFACGMGEGRFPASDGDDPLDLRGAKRMQGDASPRERDRYALLEVLLGARDRLALSYVSRDALTGDALPPSSVIEELVHMLRERYAVDVEALRRRHPLRRWDARYFPELVGGGPSPLGTMVLPEARAEAQCQAIRASAERAGALVTLGEIAARDERGEPDWKALAKHLGVASLPIPPSSADGRARVSLYVLSKFLEQPLQGWAKLRLGFEQDDEDLVAQEIEPLETHPRETTPFLRDILFAAADQGRPVAEVYDEMVRGRAPRGLGPSGLFARGEREDHLRALHTWTEELAKVGLLPGDLEVHKLGRSSERARVHHAHEPLVVEVDAPDERGVLRLLRVELTGRTMPVGRHPRVSVALAKRVNEGTDEWARAGRHRSMLRVFVDYAVLVASGAAPGDGHEGLVVVATGDKPAVERARFPALSPEAARGWLRGVLRDLLSGSHAYFLPCEAALVHEARGGEGPVTQVVLEAQGRRGGASGAPGLSSSYGPVPHPELQPVLDESAARITIERRLRPVLDALPHEEP